MAMLFVLALASLFGCSTSVSLGQHDGGTPVRCGPFDCALGEQCCSPSCGLCVAPGEVCIERSCGGPCDPFLAGGTGTCRVSLGFAWNGSACAVVAGCACVGVDCSRLYPSAAECAAAHLTCTPPSFCLTDGDCAPDSFCLYPEGACSVAAGLAGTCVSRPTPAPCPAIYAPVCGCDGVTYDNECSAAEGGISVAFPGTCDACAPDDAVAVGTCDTLLGTAWDGVHCAELRGCECVGTDCPSDPSVPPCELVHERCAPPDLPCGATSCYRRSEYCLIRAGMEGMCTPAEACSPGGLLSCDCIPSMWMGSECVADGDGGITVVVP